MTKEPHQITPRRFNLASLQVISHPLAALVVAGALTLMVSDLLTYPAVRAALDQRAGDGSADLYTLALHHRIVKACLLAVFCSVLLTYGLVVYRSRVVVSGRQLAGECKVFLGRLVRSLIAAWPALAITGIIATVTRWPFIHLPMRFDESYTYLQYASQPLYVTVSKYDAPNNHVLHSVLVWLATQLAGNSPEVIRCPAFVCGVLTAIVAACRGTRRSGCWVGAVTGCVVAVSSILVEYSVNARGYTLVHLLVMLIWVVGDEWSQRPTRVGLYIAAGLAALALWTMPTAIYPLIVMAVFVWGTSRTASAECLPANINRELLRAGLVTLGLTLLLYSPLLVVSGIASITSAGQGQFDGLGSWSRGVAASWTETFSLLDRDQPSITLVVMLVGIVGSSQPSHAGRWVGLGMVGCLLVITIQRVAPPPRTWLFLWPLLCSLGVVGWDDSLRAGTLKLRGATLVGLLLIGGVCPVWALFRDSSIVHSRETGICPDAEAIIADLRSHLEPDEPIIAITPASAPLAYYALRDALPAEHFFRPNAVKASTRRAFIVLARDPDQSITEVLDALSLSETYSHHHPQIWREYPAAVVFELIPLDQ